MVEDQTGDAGTRKQNRLGNLPSKENGKANNTNKNGWPIVDRTSRENNDRSRDGSGSRGSHAAHERVQLRILGPALVRGCQQDYDKIDRQKYPERSRCRTRKPSDEVSNKATVITTGPGVIGSNFPSPTRLATPVTPVKRPFGHLGRLKCALLKFGSHQSSCVFHVLCVLLRFGSRLWGFRWIRVTRALPEDK